MLRTFVLALILTSVAVAAQVVEGRVNFPAVRPGEYYGFAIAADGPVGFHFADLIEDEGLLKQAASVKVRGNEAISAELRLVKR